MTQRHRSPEGSQQQEDVSGGLGKGHRAGQGTQGRRLLVGGCKQSTASPARARRVRRASCCRRPGEQSGLLCGKVGQWQSPASRDRDIYTDALEAFQQAQQPIPEEGSTAARTAASTGQGERQRPPGSQRVPELCWGQVGNPLSWAPRVGPCSVQRVVCTQCHLVTIPTMSLSPHAGRAPWGPGPEGRTLTSSMPWGKGLSSQSFSGNRCRIWPWPSPLPAETRGGEREQHQRHRSPDTLAPRHPARTRQRQVTPARSANTAGRQRCPRQQEKRRFSYSHEQTACKPLISRCVRGKAEVQLMSGHKFPSSRC